MTRAFRVLKTGLTDARQAPRGSSIYYRCERCKDVLSSQPKDNVGCKCSNVRIDIDYIRLFVKDFGKFTVVEMRDSHS